LFSLSRTRPWLAALLWLVLLLAGAARFGLLSTDEPRYAAVGQAMAATGDWVTPRLWGKPWFEKPPLIYWMTALAFRAGLEQESAPRTPVALASVALLTFLFFETRRNYGERAAWFVSALLATSAGWLAYSRIAVTDLPMAACFTAAWLVALRPGVRSACVAGVFLGLAVLAKALVPLVLFLPVAWLMRRRLRDLAALAASSAAVALPWFVLCYTRNGMPFLNDLIWKQHFSRFATSALQHVQPWWYYLPVLLGGLFPWTPLLALAGLRRLYEDATLRLAGAIALFGFVFFSAARNKLPGYLLPLLPAVALLVGVGLDRATRKAAALALGASGLLLALLGWIPSAIGPGVAGGISHVGFYVPLWAWAVAAPCATAAFAAAWTNRREWSATVIVSVFLAAYLAFLWRGLPELDRTVSARLLWRNQVRQMISPCVSNLPRELEYSLYYYAGGPVPACPER
jgi:4-amino-4-deoxy-L-arabinose transferase-like glycosyltransferase